MLSLYSSSTAVDSSFDQFINITQHITMLLFILRVWGALLDLRWVPVYLNQHRIWFSPCVWSCALTTCVSTSFLDHKQSGSESCWQDTNETQWTVPHYIHCSLVLSVPELNKTMHIQCKYGCGPIYKKGCNSDLRGNRGIVVLLLDLDPQGRWFDSRCGHDKKPAQLLGPWARPLTPHCSRGYVSCLV